MGLGPGWEFWAPRGGLGSEEHSGSGAGSLDHGMVVWTTTGMWTIIKEQILCLRSGP